LLKVEKAFADVPAEYAEYFANDAKINELKDRFIKYSAEEQMRRNSKHAEALQDSAKLLNMLYDSKASAEFHETVAGARKLEIEAYYEKLNVTAADEYSKHDKAVE
tara:strand:- start:1562 stop:1879 length:318 start_codon:yes stop_codon:yes gene_type:complete